MSQKIAVTICATDSSGPYNLKLKKKLVSLGEERKIDYRINIYNYYGSDVSLELRLGGQVRHRLIGSGVDASYTYENT